MFRESILSVPFRRTNLNGQPRLSLRRKTSRPLALLNFIGQRHEMSRSFESKTWQSSPSFSCANQCTPFAISLLVGCFAGTKVRTLSDPACATSASILLSDSCGYNVSSRHGNTREQIERCRSTANASRIRSAVDWSMDWKRSNSAEKNRKLPSAPTGRKRVPGFTVMWISWPIRTQAVRARLAGSDPLAALAWGFQARFRFPGCGLGCTLSMKSLTGSSLTPNGTFTEAWRQPNTTIAPFGGDRREHVFQPIRFVTCNHDLVLIVRSTIIQSHRNLVDRILVTTDQAKKALELKQSLE